MCKGATCWLSQRMRTQDVVRAPFPSLSICPSLSIGIWMWVVGQGRGAFLSYYCPLGRFGAWPRLDRESKAAKPAFLETREGGVPAETPTRLLVPPLL